MFVEYTARSDDGSSVQGTFEAATLSEARDQLRTRGLYPVTLNEGGTGQSGRAGGGRSRRGRVPKSELMLATSQLAIMTRSGVDLADALLNVADQCQHPVLKKTLQNVHEEVSGGQTVSGAMRNHMAIFGVTYVAMIASGEASGTLNDVLSRLAEMLRNEIRFRSTVVSILAYPAVLVVVAGFVVTALIMFVLPQFGTIFRDMGKPAPPTTQMLLDISEFLRGHLLLVGGCAAGLLALLLRLRQSDAARMKCDRWMLTAPVIRGASQALLSGRMLRLLGTMLATGVPLLEALRLCASAVENRVFRSLLEDLEEEVVNGRGLAQAMIASPYIPPGAAQMAATAEKSGRLGEVLQAVGEFYEEEGERKLRQAVKLLEPAIILMMGAVVATVVLSVMLPLLDVSSVGK